MKLLWGGSSVPTVASGANPFAESPPNAGAAATMTPGQSSKDKVSQTKALGMGANPHPLAKNKNWSLLWDASEAPSAPGERNQFAGQSQQTGETTPNANDQSSAQSTTFGDGSEPASTVTGRLSSRSVPAVFPYCPTPFLPLSRLT